MIGFVSIKIAKIYWLVVLFSLKCHPKWRTNQSSIVKMTIKKIINWIDLKNYQLKMQDRKKFIYLVLFSILCLTVIKGAKSEDVDLTIEEAPALKPIFNSVDKIANNTESMTEYVESNTIVGKEMIEIFRGEVAKTENLVIMLKGSVDTLDSILPFLKAFLVALVVLPIVIPIAGYFVVMGTLEYLSDRNKTVQNRQSDTVQAWVQDNNTSQNLTPSTSPLNQAKPSETTYILPHSK